MESVWTGSVRMTSIRMRFGPNVAHFRLVMRNVTCDAQTNSRFAVM